MRQFIGCDAHKKYSVFVAMNEHGETGRAVQVGHDREQFRRFLRELPAGSLIALEANGHYYWMVDEMEAAGHCPQLTNPLRAKQMMGDRKKTDKMDARALALLLRNGTRSNTARARGGSRWRKILPSSRADVATRLRLV